MRDLGIANLYQHMAENETIEGGVDKTWFCWKRWIPITVMCLAFGAYFWYDGSVGYPRKNEIRAAFDNYLADHDGKSDGWDESVADKGWPGVNDIPKLPEGEKVVHTQDSIDQQFHMAYICLALGAAALVNVFMKIGRKIKADGEAYYTPKGAKVPYADIYRLDKRKWNNKGLATAYYKVDGEEKKTTLDVLMFPKADEVMTLVEAKFKGELIERIDDDEDEEEEDGADQNGDETSSENNSTSSSKT